MVNEKKLELIEELKELRIQRDMTYQQIADATEELGSPVSLSTIKLVFSARRNHDHDYNNVLKPIADVLSPPSDDDTIELKVLQTRLELKEQVIIQLQERLAKKESRHKDREDFLIDQLNFYKDQIQFKDAQIVRLNTAIDRKDDMIRRRLLENGDSTEE